jgi:hypothetical protein
LKAFLCVIFSPLTCTTEYYTEVHLHCFLRKRYSSWFVTQQVL